MRLLFIVTLTFGLLSTSAQDKYLSNQFFSSNFLQVKNNVPTSQPIEGDGKYGEWQIVETEKSGHVILLNIVDNKALCEVGNKIELCQKDVSDKQQIWTMISNDDDTYSFTNAKTGKYLINWGPPDDIGVCDYKLAGQVNWYLSDANETTLAKPGDIIVYTKPGCGRSEYIIDYLKSNQISYVEYSTSNKMYQTKMLDDLLNYGNFKEGKITFPVILHEENIHYNIKNLEKFVHKL